MNADILLDPVTLAITTPMTVPDLGSLVTLPASHQTNQIAKPKLFTTAKSFEDVFSVNKIMDRATRNIINEYANKSVRLQCTYFNCVEKINNMAARYLVDDFPNNLKISISVSGSIDDKETASLSCKRLIYKGLICNQLSALNKTVAIYNGLYLELLNRLRDTNSGRLFTFGTLIANDDESVLCNEWIYSYHVNNPIFVLFLETRNSTLSKFKMTEIKNKEKLQRAEEKKNERKRQQDTTKSDAIEAQFKKAGASTTDEKLAYLLSIIQIPKNGGGSQSPMAAKTNKKGKKAQNSTANLTSALPNHGNDQKTSGKKKQKRKKRSTGNTERIL